MKRVSLTPAVFHLSDRVNAIASEYGLNPIPPRGPGLKPVLDRVRTKLAESFNAMDTHDAVIFTAAGSGSIAATMGSCISDQGVLVIANGIYGERQADFCRQLGIRTIQYSLEYGDRPDPEIVEKLAKEHKVGTISMVHGCSSTCNLNPVGEIGSVAHRLGLRFIVDAISSAFVEEIDLKEWHIDAMICSVNKGLHSYPDLSFVMVSKDYLKEMETRPGRIPYLDIVQTWKQQIQGKHPFTIHTRALLETDAALDDFFKRGGVFGRIKMYQERCKLLREGYKNLGLELFKKEGMPLQSIGTALLIPHGISYDDLADSLFNWKCDDDSDEIYEIYSAQGKLEGKVFRIFHMGEYPIETYERFLNALEVVLNEQRSK